MGSVVLGLVIAVMPNLCFGIWFSGKESVELTGHARWWW